MPAFLAAGLPVNSNTFMLVMVMSSSVSAVLLVFNLLSLKHKSANRACIFSVVLLILGFMINNATIGVQFESGSLNTFKSTPGYVAFALVCGAVVFSIVGLIQSKVQHRFRR